MRNCLIPAILLSGATLGALPAQAQSTSRGAIEGRVDRLEGEMRAVQRKVFPGGTGQYVQPDNAPENAQSILPGSPTSPVADLTTRVDSLETQIRGVVGQVESLQHRQQLLENRIKALEANAAAAPSPVVAEPGGTIDRPTPTPSATSTSIQTPASTSARPAAEKPPVARPAPARPAIVATRPSAEIDPARAAKVAAVEKPETGDEAEDAYLYGYRLWTAKLYPEAETQFKAVTARYARHKRASYAQNLLGRSYLDDGKPSLASLAFYDSYKNWPDGDRAPESLYYLAQSLVKLDKPPAQVCKVYTELTRSYGAKVDADPKMKAGVVKGKAASGCS